MKRSVGAVEAAAMLLAGILIGSIVHPSLLLCAAAFAVFTAGGIYFYRQGKVFVLDQWQNKVSRVLICAAILTVGLARNQFSPGEQPVGSVMSFIGQGQIRFTGYVIAPPVVSNSRTTLRVAVDARQNDSDSPTDGKLLLVFYHDPGQVFYYGDRLQIGGQVIQPPDTGGGFSYRTYLERDGITAMINNPTVEKLPGFKGEPLLSKIYGLRETLVNRVYQLFSSPESALMAGILLGDESKIPADVDHAFQKTGTAHIIAISGANFTVLTWLVLSILRRLIRQWWAPLFMLPFIAFYTILVGGNAAVVRAAIMCGLSIFGSVLGRTGNGVNNLALTAAIMGLFKPAMIFDVGFQLSVMATQGILLFSEPLCNGARWLISKIIPKISEDVLSRTVSILNDLCLMSISAQVFTMWITAKAFGRLSLISLAANFLIAPFQSLIMLGGFAALILSYIFYPLGAAAAWLIWAAPALTIRIVEKCAEIRWGSVYFDLSPLQAWLIIGGILVLYLGRRVILNYIRRRDYGLVGIMVLMFAAVMIWVNVLDHLDKRTELEFSETGTSLTLKVRSPEKRLFVIAEGLTNYASQELLEKQILPVARVPEAAWIDISEEWMQQAFAASGAGDELSVFYLNGETVRGPEGAPERMEPGFVFTADGVALRMVAAYLGKRAWTAGVDGINVLVPNGIPPERIFTRSGLVLSEVSMVLLGKRDDPEVWRSYNETLTLLDRSDSGIAELYIKENEIGIF